MLYCALKLKRQRHWNWGRRDQRRVLILLEEVNDLSKSAKNLQNKLLNITVLFIWYLLASLKKMSLAKHGELYFILASICFSPLAILASVWKKWFPTLYGETCLNQSLKKTESCINLTKVPMVFELYKFKLTKFDCISI